VRSRSQGVAFHLRTSPVRNEAACTGYGFKAGTNEFGNCLQRESLARRYAHAPPPPYWAY